MKAFKKILFLCFLFFPVGLTAQIVNGWELLPPQTYDVNNTFSRLENGYQTFKTSGITFDAGGGKFDQITNYRKNFSNIISSGNKKTPKFFGFDYKISELIGDITTVQIALAVLSNNVYIYDISLGERVENPIVDGWKRVKFSTEKIIGVVPEFSKLEFMFWGISNKVGYISMSISIDNLFGEDSLGVKTIYDVFDITSVPSQEIPSRFQLSQNYPNPFNPTTRIKFALPKESNVTLNIYNLLGQEVETLISKVMSVGYHTVDFNATNLPSGMYVYRIEAGNFVQSKKMLLMK